MSLRGPSVQRLLPEVFPAGIVSEALSAERSLASLDRVLADPVLRARFTADQALSEAVCAARLEDLVVRWDEVAVTALRSSLAPRNNRAAAIRAFDIWRTVSALMQQEALPRIRPEPQAREAGPEPGAEAWTGGFDWDSEYVTDDSGGDEVESDGDDEVLDEGGAVTRPFTPDWIEEIARRSQLRSSGRTDFLLTDLAKARLNGLLFEMEMMVSQVGILSAALVVKWCHLDMDLEPREQISDPYAGFRRGVEVEERLQRYVRERSGPSLDFAIARLIAPVCLRRACGLGNLFMPISRTLLRDVQGYRRALHGSDEEWLLWFCGRIRISADQAQSRVREISRISERWSRKLGKRRRNSRTGAAVEYLFTRPALSVRALQNELGSTFRGAQLIMDELVAAGVVKEISTRRIDRIFLAQALEYD